MRTPRERSQRAQRAGDDRQHDVVDRAAERVLDALEVVELGCARPRSRRCGPIGDVERRLGRGVQARPGDLADALGRLAQRVAAAGRVRRGRERARRPSSNGVRARPVTPRARAARRSRLGLRLPTARRSCGAACGIGREVEQHGREVDAGDAVDERVVGLGDQREAVVLEALRRATSPTAASSGRAAGRRSARRARAAARSVPGAGSARVAHVVLEVEARVVDPERPAGLERREGELLAVARDEVQARADVRRANSS